MTSFVYVIMYKCSIIFMYMSFYLCGCVDVQYVNMYACVCKYMCSVC